MVSNYKLSMLYGKVKIGLYKSNDSRLYILRNI